MVPHLCNSLVYKVIKIDAPFNGLLAELPAILNSFFHQYHK